jgi:O-antigen ligase
LRPAPLRRISIGASAVVAAAAMPVALLLGVLIASRPARGIAFVVGLAFATIALLDLPLALACWAGLISSRNLTIVWIGPNVASLVLLVAWLGASREGRRLRTAVMRRHRALVATMLLLLVWLTLSALWAGDPGAVYRDVWTWWAAGLVVAVVATALPGPRDVRVVVVGFVVGSAVSVFAGLALTGLHPLRSAVQSAAIGDRLSGGLADPNYLAAGLVPAIVLGSVLLGSVRSLLGRLGLVVCIALCGVGLVATESRGGLVAAAVAAVASLVVFRQRARVALCLLLVVSVGGVYAAGSPTTLQRIGDLDGGGSGRSDLWHVAWRIGATQPIHGIGLNNFVARSQDFVREPGALREVHVIVEQPVLVHNTYLQIWAETGLIGLALFVVVVGGLLAAALRAAQRLHARGDPTLATLAQGVFVAQISVLVALVFLSAGTDPRWWTLFGLGPAMLAVASTPRMPPAVAA